MKHESAATPSCTPVTKPGAGEQKVLGGGPVPIPVPAGQRWTQGPSALCGRRMHLHLQQICLFLTLVTTQFNKLSVDSCRKESHEPSRLPFLYLYLIKPVFNIHKVLLFHFFASSRHPSLSCSVEADDLTRRCSGRVLPGQACCFTPGDLRGPWKRESNTIH